MKGLMYYFRVPIFPSKTLRELAERNDPKTIFWSVFLLHLTLFLLLYILEKFFLPGRPPRLEAVFFVFGFLFGGVIRNLMLAYLLWIASKRIFKLSWTYTQCLNNVLVCLFPFILIQFPNDLVAVIPPAVKWWICMSYSILLITLAFTFQKPVSFSRMLLLVIVCHYMLWLVVVPFMGIDI